MLKNRPAERAWHATDRLLPNPPFMYLLTYTYTDAQPTHTRTLKQSKTPPDHRLPLCYLMDSLLQNARAPYPALFARYVVPMLCRTYEFVRGADFGLV